jgi:hypothetical protein
MTTEVTVTGEAWNNFVGSENSLYLCYSLTAENDLQIHNIKASQLHVLH